MLRKFLIRDRQPQELQEFGKRLIQINLLGLVQIPGSPGEDEADDWVVCYARYLIERLIHDDGFRISSTYLGVTTRSTRTKADSG